VTGFAGKAIVIDFTGAVGSDAGLLIAFVLSRADVPFLAALPVAAGLLRTALATAFFRSQTPIAAALPFEANLIRVAAAIVSRPRLVMLADRPAALHAADRIRLVGTAIDEQLDKAVCTARVATHLAALGLDAARLLRRTITAAVAAGRDWISSG